MRRSTVLAVLTLFLALPLAAEQQAASQRYHVTTAVTLTNAGFHPDKVIVVLPLPRTNDYQEISNVDTHGGVVTAIAHSEDSCVRFLLKGKDAAFERKQFECEYDVRLHQIDVHVERIARIHPYPTGSQACSLYRSKCGEFVVPDDPKIKSIGDSLWRESSDALAYARRCYEYVASSFHYLKPNTGLHTLATIFEDKGGDCGNLSSVLVSLLRYKGIPARHLVAVRPDGSCHVWADFYLESYGWIPLDVTYKNANPSGDYFGKVSLGSNGIIQNSSVDMNLDIGDNNTQRLSLLQTFAWWCWGSGNGKLSASYALRSSPIQ